MNTFLWLLVLVVFLCFLSAVVGFLGGFIYCGKLFARAVKSWLQESEDPIVIQELLDTLKKL